jgi:hypothetical protein
MDSKYGEGPTYARATPQFQGSEWFSTVVIRIGENDKEYGQLRVLFKCNILTRGGQRITKELSLVKMYSLTILCYNGKKITLENIRW